MENANQNKTGKLYSKVIEYDNDNDNNEHCGGLGLDGLVYVGVGRETLVFLIFWGGLVSFISFGMV